MSHVHVTLAVTDDYLRCKPGGCSHCSPASPDPCCDGCSPSAFKDLLHMLEVTLPPNARTPKTKVRAYTREEADMRLRAALNAWRQATMVANFGEALMKEVGSSLVLPDVQLERIVDCAHGGAIKSVDDLRREVDWYFTDELGLDILDIINKNGPSSLPLPPPPLEEACSGPEAHPLGPNNRILNAPSNGAISSLVSLFFFFVLSNKLTISRLQYPLKAFI